jgi:hypothetical protein
MFAEVFGLWRLVDFVVLSIEYKATMGENRRVQGENKDHIL